MKNVCCAHQRVSYRTRESRPGLVVKAWWECDSGCGQLFTMTESPDVAPPNLGDILSWLTAEASHWDGLRTIKDVLGRDAAYRMYQTNLIWQRLDEWRDTGKEPNHGLE